jgi:vancomycin resistance protein YoaR
MTTTTLRSPRAAILRGPRGPRGALLGFVATMGVGVLVLISASIVVAAMSSGRVLPGVSIGGVELGGLDRAAAVVRLDATLPSLDNGTATLIIDGKPSAVPFAAIGRGYETQAMADAALAFGREGNPFTSTGARLRSLVAATSLPILVHASDPAALGRVAVATALRFSTPPIDATVTLVDGAWTVTPAIPGTALDPRVVRDALAQRASSSAPGDTTIELATVLRPPALTTDQAHAAAAMATAMAGTPLALTLDAAEKPVSLTAAQLATVVSFADRDGIYTAQIDDAAVQSLLASVAKKVVRAPRGATFAFGGGGPTAVVAAVTGRTLDARASGAALRLALQRRASGATVPAVVLATSVTQPALTTAAAQAALPRMQRIGTWTTYFVPGEGNFWGANITIPANDIDGRTLAPGEWFSFWNSIGEVSKARGYGDGGAIIGGRSVKNGALAGGICSTSTTMFNAALRAGLNMGERTNHYYYINRYPMGLDATVFRTDSYAIDMTFQNDTPDPLLIRSYTGYGFVRFDVWGTPTGRAVSFSQPYVRNPRTASDVKVVDSSLRPGTAVRVEYPHDGFDVSVTRWVRDASGALIHEDHFFSAYRTVTGVTRVGPAAPAPASPPTAG